MLSPTAWAEMSKVQPSTGWWDLERKDAGRGSTEGKRQQAVRNTLVVLEVAMSLVLLIGAGLVIKSFILLQRVEPGFDPNNALTVSLSLPERKYRDKNRQATFYEQLIERVSALPGVQATGASSNVPFSYAHFGFPSGASKSRASLLTSRARSQTPFTSR